MKRNPDSTVGVDEACFSAESIARMPTNEPWYEGPPVLAVEILSPSDTHEDMVQKVHLYLECGVAVVWIIDPDLQTMTIHRPQSKLQVLRDHEILEGDPELPNLKVPVREFFN